MKKPLTIRLSPEAREAMQRLAERDSRSLSSWVEHQVREMALQKGAWSPRLVDKSTKSTKSGGG